MAPHEEDKAMDGLLRRNLARGADSGLVCPEPDILAAYFERSLDADEVGRYELHFSQCSRCREQLAAMARAGASAGAGASGATAASSRWVWLWDWRWLAVPAAAALAFAIFGFLWMRPAKETARLESAAPPVALSRPVTPPSAQVAPRLDEGAREDVIAPAQKQIRPPATDMASSHARGAAGNAPAARLTPPSPPVSHNATSAMNAQAEGALTAALAKASKQGQPVPAADKVAPPGGASQMVTVESAAPVVETPAKPQVEARQTGAAAAGANTSANSSVNANAASVTVETTGANALELQDSATKSKKSSKQSHAAAAQAEVAKTKRDYSELMTIEGKPAATMILTPDPAILWRFAGSGFVERSTDGGATWQGEQPSLGGQLLAGAAPSVNVCWLVGRDGLILLTKDAKSWKKISPPEETDFIAVSAENAPNAIVTAADGRKFATRNGGKKWKPAQ